MSLWASFLTNERRVIHKWKHYFPAYEHHFQRFVDRPVVFWEIGCGKGGSLQMWKRYLGPHAQIVGLDIRPACREFREDQIEIRIGNQADLAFLDAVLQEFGPPDVVLDDGSHMMEHIVATFGHVYPRLDKNGVYMVEDLHTAYWSEFGGGIRREGTFIELCKNLIDELNGAHWENVTEFTASTLSMHFYDSIVVFEKGRHAAPRAFRTPAQKRAPGTPGRIENPVHADEPDCR